MTAPLKFVALLEKLIRDGRDLLQTSYQGTVRDGDGLRRWSNDLILLQCIGGADLLAPWRRRIMHNGYHTATEEVKRPLAALETVKYVVDNGLLTTYRGLVLAEEFTNLYQQGAHLLEQGYALAAAVIFRAVLEEKLRELCLANGCMPEKERPAINDLNQALYKCEVIQYDKAMMLNATALAAIGNNAAHNSTEFSEADVGRLRQGTLDFLSRYGE